MVGVAGGGGERRADRPDARAEAVVRAVARPIGRPTVGRAVWGGEPSPGAETRVAVGMLVYEGPRGACSCRRQPASGQVKEQDLGARGLADEFQGGGCLDLGGVPLLESRLTQADAPGDDMDVRPPPRSQWM